MPIQSFETEYHKLARRIELAEILGQQSDFDEILRVVTQQAASLLNVEMALMMMINPHTHQTLKTLFRQGQAAQQRHFHGCICK